MSKGLLVLATALAAAALFSTPAATAPNSIVSPDTVGSVGKYTSLVMDENGGAVVAYYDLTNGDLKLLRCPTADCSSDVSITSPDTSGDVGRYPSVILDAGDNPVVSYYDVTNGDLKILYCGNADCTSANTLASPDTDGDVGVVPSLALSANGNPVIAYYDFTNFDLKILHCGDATCGSGNTIIAADTTGDVGDYPSLELDTNGYPVVSYFDRTNADLKILRCGNTSCTAGNVITAPDAAGDVGYWTSLELDPIGNPVVSYSHWDVGEMDLKILHCGDVTCSSGNTVVTADAVGDIGLFTSLALDEDSHPVISYWDATNNSLTVLHCGDPNCTSPNNAIVSADSTGDVGRYTSLGLSNGRIPVVSYYDFENEDLKLLHCPTCDVDTDSDGCTNSQEGGSDERQGGRRDPSNPWDYFNPTGDGQNRIDDILAVVTHYFVSEGEPGYDQKYDRTYLGPEAWNLGPPDGAILVDDLVHIVNSYFHDCA